MARASKGCKSFDGVALTPFRSGTENTHQEKRFWNLKDSDGPQM